MANKKKNLFWIIYALLLVVAISFVGYQDLDRINFTDEPCIQITVGESEFCVWVADDDEEHKQGLSNTYLGEFESLEFADGMLFIFDDSKIRYFWMKDMEFELDVLWIDNNRIQKIEEFVPVFQFDLDSTGEKYLVPGRMDSGSSEVNMVLELPAGYVEEYGIKVGQTVSIDEIE